MRLLPNGATWLGLYLPSFDDALIVQRGCSNAYAPAVTLPAMSKIKVFRFPN